MLQKECDQVEKVLRLGGEVGARCGRRPDLSWGRCVPRRKIIRSGVSEGVVVVAPSTVDRIDGVEW